MSVIDIIEENIVPNIKQPLWENWYIKEKIGSGSFSVVYKIEAQRINSVDVSAMKVEAITADEQIFTDLSVKKQFLKSKRDLFDNEVRIMKQLRDSPFIVRYEDEYIKELYINGIFEGYYCLIRMEYLSNVYNLMRNRKFDYSELNVRKFAHDIGQALKAAHDINVIHRDIKPDNLFVSEKGIYKLGDFNISKKAVVARSFAGNNLYMAPEIHRAKSNVDESYTKQADIYSFGLCLYQMMNDGMLPFETDFSQFDAIEKRIRGEKFPPPENASDEFGRIIIKSCAYDVNERYHSIDEMLADLENIEKSRFKEQVKNNNRTQYADKNNEFNQTVYAETNRGKSVNIQSNLSLSESNIKKFKIIISIIAAVVLITLGIFFIPHEGKNQEEQNNASQSEMSENNKKTETESIIDNKNVIEEISVTTTELTSEPVIITTTIPAKMEYLANMELFADGSSNGFMKNEYLVDNYRNSYSSSIGVKSGYLSYLVKDTGYTHFCGTVALPKEISTDGYKTSAQLEIYIDEVLAFRSEDITNESKPQIFDIDITGAEVVKLSWNCKGINIWSDWCYYATVFDPYFSDDAYFIEKNSIVSVETTVSISDNQYLANMELFADGSSDAGGSNGFLKNVYLTDNYGNAYNSSIGVKSGYLSYLVKDMGYTHFCGTIALPKEVSPDDAKLSAQLEIYIDNELLLHSEVFTNESKPQQFDLDITNAEVIKIVWSCNGYNVWKNWCYYATVFDGQLSK